MDQEFRLLCSSGTRRLLLIIGTILALVVVVQYFEFPYGIDVSSLFSVGNVGGFSSSSEELGNKTINGIAEASNSSVVYNISPAPQEATEAEKNKTLGNAAKDDNSSIGSVRVDVASTLGGNGGSDMGLIVLPPIASPARDSSSNKGFPTDTMLIRKSRDSKKLRHVVCSQKYHAADKLNMRDKPESDYSMSGNVSSMTGVPVRQKNKPKTLKGAKPPSMLAFPISEMNHMLLQSHASSKSVVSGNSKSSL